MLFAYKIYSVARLLVNAIKKCYYIKARRGYAANFYCKRRG